MEKNVGLTDRYLRIAGGSALLSCAAARSRRGQDLLGFSMSLIGGMLLADGILGTCMMYLPLNINTRNESSGNQESEQGPW